MNTYDFRSDTVTHPTPIMREKMANAPVGDDVYEDDPTVIELEKLAAAYLGKEAAIFVPSGTFANQLAILTHTRRGDEVILGDSSHILIHEVGAAAVISGVQLRPIPTHLGRMDVKSFHHFIRGSDIHYPDTGLICIENAHSEGTVIDLVEMETIYQIGQKNNIPVHLDGARLFNAAHALDVHPSVLAKACDSLMFCLSKGLCAPFGSILLGSHTFIQKAKKNRKLMGGGLRQSGIMAAAGIEALENMVDRLKTDHSRAQQLGKELSQIPNVTVKVDQMDINMVFCKLPIKDVDHFIQYLRNENIIINPPEDNLFRFVTHYWITDEAIKKLSHHVKNYLNQYSN